MLIVKSNNFFAEPSKHYPWRHFGQSRRPSGFSGRGFDGPVRDGGVDGSEWYTLWRLHTFRQPHILCFALCTSIRLVVQILTCELAVTYLSPGGNPGDLLKGTATCDKSA